MYTCTYILLLIVSSLLFTGEKANSLSGLKDIPEETSTSARINFAYAGVLYSASDNKGFPDSLLQYHEFLILNSRININEEEDFLKKLPESFGKSYLTGLIEKRKGNFETSFDMLFGLLKYSPVYLEYYDELVYLSEINNKTILLRDFISHESTADKTDSSSAVKEYLRALIFSSGGEYKKSKSILENLVNKFAVRVPILLQLSNVQRNLGDYKKAFNTLSIIDKKFTYSGLKVLNAQGALYYLSGKYDEAKKTYLEELKFSRKLNALRYESKTLVNLGILLDEEGRVDSARAYYLTAVKSAEEINDSETKAFAYSELGVSYSFTGMLIEARKSYNESFELYKNLGNKVRLSFLSNNLGKIYLSMFNYYSALDYFKKGIEFAGENKRALVLNLIGTADVYANISNYTKALEYYERAKQLSSDIRDVTLLTDVNIGLGTLNLNLNLTANAVKYFHAADDLCRSNGGNASLSADIYNKCGILYANADSLDKAEKYFTRAIGFARQYADNYTEISSMLELAEIFISRGQAQKASLILKDIRQNPQLHSYDYLMIQSEMTLGKLNTFRKNYTEALKNFNKAAKAGKLLQESNLQIEADIEIAKILKEQELYEQAEKYYMDAFQLVQTVSRSLYHNKEVQIAYFSSKNDVYSSLADLYLSRNEFEKAFEVIESSRSRNTIQNLNNLMVQSLLSNRETLDKLYDYEWLLNSGLMSSTKLDSVRKEYDLYKMQLFKREPRLKDFLGQKNDLRIPEIQKELAKDEFVLSMFSEDSNTFLFLLSGNDFKTIKTGIRQKELLRLIENISPYFNSPAFKTESYFNQDLFSFNAKASYDFYQKIIKPVLQNIPENSRLIVSTSAEMSIIPIEFLVTKFDPNESSYDYKGKDFLLFRYNISYSPSATAYLRLKNSRLINSGQILLMGDPSINYFSNAFSQRRGLLQENTPGSPRDIMLLPLRYSKQEITEINEVIKADNVLLSEKATKENFKKFSRLSSIIHLSTHSFLYNEQPFIFFSNTGPNSSESFLETGEIAQLKLNSDLVVLSSCNSGLGLIDKAEGTLGMTKAFFEAGAKSIVVSLWDVNDNYTSKLMALFYQKLSEGYSKSEALRQAKIGFIKKYSANPYFWAAFVLSGDTSALRLNSPAGFSKYYFILISAMIFSAGYFLSKKYFLKRRYLRKNIR